MANVVKKIMICSGAGLSAESGIPTFRDADGLWEKHRVEDVCTLSTWLENYILVNEFYNARRKQLGQVDPNSAHKAIAALQESYQLINITTNVDDLLERAGCDDVIHLHGNLSEIVTRYGHDDAEVLNIGYQADSLYENPKLYPVKPNVTFMGEGAPLYQNLYNEMTNLCVDDLLIIIGSSEQIVNFAFTARYECRYTGKIVFVNKDKALAKEVVEIYGAIPSMMSATEFFDKHSIEELFALENPYPNY